jgi:hypothetical protein
MGDDYSTIRRRIHDKSHSYFVFTTDRWDKEKRNMFYGATDALLDASDAAASYDKYISTKAEHTNLLACYGFLQALYVQQDAVTVLSRVFDLKWHPKDDVRLNEIRNARNRLTGHPALAGEKSERSSSAIIPYGDITKKGFRGHVYYENESENMYVEVASFQKDNEERLALQMLLVEKAMDEQERKFRNAQAAHPFSLKFENGFDYLLQRLHCDLGNEDRAIQAGTHAKMVRDRITELEKELIDREFGPEAKLLTTVFIGLELLKNIIKNGNSSAASQAEFDLIYDGLAKHLGALRDNIKAMDAKLSSPIP